MHSALRPILSLPLWLRFAALLAPLAAATGYIVWHSGTESRQARVRLEALAHHDVALRLTGAAALTLRAVQAERAAEPAGSAAARKSTDQAVAGLREAVHAAHTAASQVGPARTAASRAAAELEQLPAKRQLSAREAAAYWNDVEAALTSAATENFAAADGGAAAWFEQLRGEAEAQATHASRLGLGFGALGMLALAFGGVLAWGAARQSTELLRVVRGLADGRDEPPAAVLADDELGTLAELLNRRAAGGGDAAVRAAVTVQLGPAAGEVAAAASAVRTYADDQFLAAAEQEGVVADSVSALALMARSADDSVARTQAFGEQARRAVEVAGAGRRAVRDALGGLETVRGQVESAAAAILALADQARQIGEIVATVNDVAEQTNLMALNAAIEASRAGEHGQGFAVVAGEIKELALQSKKATEQVKQLLGELQNATNTAALASEHGAKAAAQAGKVALEAGAAIDGLDAALAQAAEESVGIAAAAAEQSAGMGTVSASMARLEEATRQRTEALAALGDAVAALDGIGQRLEGLAASAAPSPAAAPTAAEPTDRLAALRQLTQR